MKFLLKIILFLAVSAISILAQDVKSKRDIATESVIRIKPAEYSLSPHCPKMPKQVVRYLEEQNCTIPQSYRVKNHHNAFEGEFLREGQHDWVVLCSRNKISSILIFPDSTPSEIQQIAQIPDNEFIQPIDEKGNLGFIRFIDKPNKFLLAKRHNNSDESIEFTHNGIGTLTLNRKFIVYYFHNDMFIVLDKLFNDIQY